MGSPIWSSLKPCGTTTCGRTHRSQPHDGTFGLPALADGKEWSAVYVALAGRGSVSKTDAAVFDSQAT